jgi:hypothetical protein
MHTSFYIYHNLFDTKFNIASTYILDTILASPTPAPDLLLLPTAVGRWSPRSCGPAPALATRIAPCVPRSSEAHRVGPATPCATRRSCPGSAAAACSPTGMLSNRTLSIRTLTSVNANRYSSAFAGVRPGVVDRGCRDHGCR